MRLTTLIKHLIWAKTKKHKTFFKIFGNASLDFPCKHCAACFHPTTLSRSHATSNIKTSYGLVTARVRPKSTQTWLLRHLWCVQNIIYTSPSPGILNLILTSRAVPEKKKRKKKGPLAFQHVLSECSRKNKEVRDKKRRRWEWGRLLGNSAYKKGIRKGTYRSLWEEGRETARSTDPGDATQGHQDDHWG